MKAPALPLALFLAFLFVFSSRGSFAQPDDGTAAEHWRQAVEKYNDGDYGAATVHLRRILHGGFSPQESMAWLLLGQCQLHLKHFAEAEKSVKELILKYPHGRYAPYGNYLWAQIFYLQQDYYDAALELLQAAQAAQDDELKLLARGKLERVFELFLRGDQRDLLMAWVKRAEIRAELSAIQQGYRLPERVGVVLPLSGPRSDVGLEVLAGIEAACAETRKRLRLDIEVIARDSRGSSVEAIRAAHSLIMEEGALGLIGNLDEAGSAAVAAVAAEQEIVLVLPATREANLTDIGGNVFQMMPDLFSEGSSAAEYLVQEAGVKKAAVLAPASSEGLARVEGFRKYFEASGGVLSAIRWYHEETTNFRPLLASLMPPQSESLPFVQTDNAEDSALTDFFDAKGAIYTDSTFLSLPLSALDALYVPMQGTEMPFLGPQLALLGFHGILMGSCTCLDYLSQEATRRYFDGLIFPSVYPNMLGWTAESEFDRIYRSRTGVLPNRWNALGWDAYHLLAQGFKDSGKLSGRKINRRLNEIRHYDGVQQRLRFPEGERMNQAIRILRYEDGELKDLGIMGPDGFQKP